MSDAAAFPCDKDARIAALEAALAARDSVIAALRVQLAQLRRMTFGPSSEKLTLQIEQLELALEELEGEAELADVHQPTAKQPERPAPVRSLPPHLPREERRIEPADGSCTCPDCGGTLRPLSEDSDEMLDVLPVQWRVVRTVRPKYSCRACEKIVQAPAPPKAIARGKASFATLAHVVVNKFDHHLPLYRQAEMMAAQGIDIDRSTLAGWAGQAAALLDPIVARIREEGLKATKIHADDTPVPMLDPGCGKTATARLWTYVVDDRAAGSTSPTPLTTDLLERIAQLYAREAEIRGQPPDARRRHRQDHSKPMVEELRIAIDDALRRLSPKSAMAKALAYGRKRWTALTRFLHDGRAEIDNNIAERAIRSIAIGRKNWLFAGSKAGGERAAAIYSVIETAKLNGIEPQAYIADVIAKIADDWPASRWDELMPWNWTAAQPSVSMAA